jgi:hypothetical protein
MDRQELLAKLGVAWKRSLNEYIENIYCVYADEALTGFVLIVDKPIIGQFNNQQTLLIPLSQWVMLKTLADVTVTPVRIVAVGKKVIVGAWRPHSGLKYAIRNEASGPAMVHIPLEDLKPLG